MLVVTVPATNHRLVTLEVVKAELRVTGTSEDDFLGNAIDRASAAIERWCNRVFAVETVRETFARSQLAGFHMPAFGNSSDSLVLTRWPVVSLVSVTESGSALATSAYEFDPASGLLYRLGNGGLRRPWMNGAAVVEYQAGYVLPGDDGRDLPADIERAAVMLVKAEWFARDRDPLVKTEDVTGVLATTYWVGGIPGGGTLPPDVEGLLSPYRSPAVG